MTGQACLLHLVARSEDRGYVASGSSSAPGVRPKISMYGGRYMRSRHLFPASAH
jgi:hypothetical protein